MKNKLLLITGALLTLALCIALVLYWRDGNWEALKKIGYALMIASFLMFVIFTPLWRRFRDDTNAAMLRDYGEDSFFYAQRQRQAEQGAAARYVTNEDSDTDA